MVASCLARSPNTINNMTSSPSSSTPSASRGRLKLLLVLLVCASPVIASYFTYYVIRPEGRVNYADLIEPQRPVSELPVSRPDGSQETLSSLRGKWVLVVLGSPACDATCTTSLYNIRQVRMTTGRERERVERLWLLTEPGEPDPALLAQHEGLVVRRIAPEHAAQFEPAEGGRAANHTFIIDPLGNLMMRYPAQPDPSKMKKDLRKLLRASRIG
jgi:cytochrome oxidase Cu insertion factor (SCO1/SenC/PrrC family)